MSLRVEEEGLEVESGSAPNSNAGTSRSVSLSFPSSSHLPSLSAEIISPLQHLSIVDLHHIRAAVLVYVNAGHLPGHTRAPSEAPTSSRLSCTALNYHHPGWSLRQHTPHNMDPNPPECRELASPDIFQLVLSVYRASRQIQDPITAPQQLT